MTEERKKHRLLLRIDCVVSLLGNERLPYRRNTYWAAYRRILDYHI